MKTFLKLFVLSALLIFFQACAKKPQGDGSADRTAADNPNLAGSCKTKSSDACADYLSDGAAELKSKLKENCEKGDLYGAGTYSASACVSGSARVARCAFAKSEAGTAYSVVINYYASMNLTAAQIEGSCRDIKGTFSAN